MNYYPRIFNTQNALNPIPWIVEPLEVISHDGILGLMENGRLLNPLGEIISEIPETFYGRELVTLATGTDEEIISVSKSFGLLVSPFSKVVHKGQEAGSAEISGSVTDAERAAICESVSLAQAYEETGGKLTGAVVSLAEIRVVAARLLDALHVIRAIGEGLSASELAERMESGELSNLPIQSLRYIEYCLEGNDLLGISLTLVDEEESMVNGFDVEELEALSLGEEVEADILCQLPLLRSICWARPKELASLTVAVALGIRNFATDMRRWASCDYCNNEFPLRPGQRRKIKEPRDMFCSHECKNAAEQKKWRDKKKLADLSNR